MLGETLDFCGKQGYFDFARTSLLPECRNRLAHSQFSDEKDGWLRRSLRDWFPTQQELAEELTRIVGMEEFHRGFQVDFMLKRFQKTDQPLKVFFETLEAWLTEASDMNHFVVSATAVRYWGKRGNLRLLENCSYAQSEVGQELLADARYDVFRRSLE